VIHYYQNSRFATTEIVLLLATCLGGGRTTLALSPGNSDIPQIQTTEEKGRAEKAIALGDAYLTGRGVPQDLQLAASWYEKAAGLGDPVAQNQIGYFYQVGMGVLPDAARAVHWYQLSSAGGFTLGKVNLALAYFWGTGVERDAKTAERLLIEAANRGSSVAPAYLGEMYYFGVGVQKDEAVAERWYEKAIKVHSYLADYRMGKILSEPNEHPRNIERALSLLRESASLGFVPAMHSAGLLLVNHPALCTSLEESLSLLNEAASAGEWRSSFVLGALARDGKWVPHDPRSAYFHFRVGAVQGGETASALVQNDLRILTEQISSEERVKIDEDAIAWAQKHIRNLRILYKDRKDGANIAAFALADPQSGSHAGSLIPIAPF
jgi:hypothetical protein